jgi:hypothetical protein
VTGFGLGAHPALSAGNGDPILGGPWTGSVETLSKAYQEGPSIAMVLELKPREQRERSAFGRHERVNSSEFVERLRARLAFGCVTLRPAGTDAGHVVVETLRHFSPNGSMERGSRSPELP